VTVIATMMRQRSKHSRRLIHVGRDSLYLTCQPVQCLVSTSYYLAQFYTLHIISQKFRIIIRYYTLLL